MGVSTVLDIKNFGKIEYAKIDIKPLTIVVGLNDTGKSFVTKGLYSILSAFNIDYLTMQSEQIIKIANIYIQKLDEELGSAKDKKQIKYIDELLEELATFIKDLKKSNFNLQEAILTSNEVKSIKNNLKNVFLNFEDNIKKRVIVYKKTENYLAPFGSLLKELDVLTTDTLQVYGNKVIESIRENLIKNFQVEISTLHNFNNKTKSINFDLNNFCQIELLNNSNRLSLNPSGVDEIQKLRNVIYIDSPIFIRLKEAFEAQEKNKSFKYRNFLDKEDILKGYPKYIDDLYALLNQKTIFENNFSDLINKIENIINGSVDINSNNEIKYTISNTSHTIPISLAAMGIANLGIISLLLKKGIIDKGSFLILDEPEVHLHPEWQIKLIEILYELSKNGINVVIATHSIDLIKYIQLLVKKDEEAKKNIAINLMPYSESNFNLSLEDKIDNTLDVLVNPYYNMHIESLKWI